MGYSEARRETVSLIHVQNVGGVVAPLSVVWASITVLGAIRVSTDTPQYVGTALLTPQMAHGSPSPRTSPLHPLRHMDHTSTRYSGVLGSAKC